MSHWASSAHTSSAAPSGREEVAPLKGVLLGQWLQLGGGQAQHLNLPRLPAMMPDQRQTRVRLSAEEAAKCSWRRLRVLKAKIGS